MVSNDVNTLAVAEQWFGYGRGSESFAVVTVGAGVGCGLVLGAGCTPASAVLPVSYATYPATGGP